MMMMMKLKKSNRLSEIYPTNIQRLTSFIVNCLKQCSIGAFSMGVFHKVSEKGEYKCESREIYASTPYRVMRAQRSAKQ